MYYFVSYFESNICFYLTIIFFKKRENSLITEIVLVRQPRTGLARDGRPSGPSFVMQAKSFSVSFRLAEGVVEVACGDEINESNKGEFEENSARCSVRAG